MASASQATGDNYRQILPKWKPEENQLRILNEVFHNNGGRTPIAAQIYSLSTQLQQYGPVEPKNVFFWFENKKRKEGKNPISSAPINPVFNVAPSRIVPHSTYSTITNPTTVISIPTILFKMQTIVTSADHGRSSSVINIINVSEPSGLIYHFQEVGNAMKQLCHSEPFGNLNFPLNEDSPNHDGRTLPLFPAYSSNPAYSQNNSNIIGAPIHDDIDLELKL